MKPKLLAPTLAFPTQIRMLVCMAVVLVPHFPRLPLWESVFVSSVFLWRALASYRHWQLPPTWLKLILSFCAFGGIMASYGQINGQHAGVALLVIMTSLKLTEMKTRRDNSILIFVCYFLLITHFLFSQELGMAVYLMAAALLITSVMVEISHPQGPLPLKVILRGGGVLILHSLPLMLILFVLFPRIPGPLWGLPSDAGAGRTGLSEKMEPGSISALSQSDAVAFRVRFLDPAPPNAKLYWRGPIFWNFDGHAWSTGRQSSGEKPLTAEIRGRPTRYEVTLEPDGERWLLALDIPVDGPAGTSQTSGHEVLAEKPVNDRMQYVLTSYTDYRIDAVLSDQVRERALQLPFRGNPRTRELAQQWRSQGMTDDAIMQRALHMLHDEKFFYTLQPPLLGNDNVDEFLFGSRRGFCEHYASSFTFLMRAAGIPARVVTGYQGAELNPNGGYYIVRQSDAHAWSEVWLQGRGWLRVDPTAAVAPERIERGLSSALSLADRAAMPFAARGANGLLHLAQLRWDWINSGWNQWVLAYGPDLQQEFLNHFGLPDYQAMILALTALMFGFLAALGGVLLWQARPAIGQDAALRHWENFCNRLAKQKLARLPYEGPRDYARRILLARPDLRTQVMVISALYIDLRYAGISDPSREQRLAQSVRRFKP